MATCTSSCVPWSCGLIDPDDQAAREELRGLLGRVSHSDAPVLVRWRTLLDRRLPLVVDAEG